MYSCPSIDVLLWGCQPHGQRTVNGMSVTRNGNWRDRYAIARCAGQPACHKRVDKEQMSALVARATRTRNRLTPRDLHECCEVAHQSGRFPQLADPYGLKSIACHSARSVT